MLFSRLLHFLPLKILTVLHQVELTSLKWTILRWLTEKAYFKVALVVPHGYSWSFTIRPNDLREDRLPRDITESIHWLVSTRFVCGIFWQKVMLINHIQIDFRHRSRKRRPFSRYAARRGMNSIYREKSISIPGDSKLIEEKLDQVAERFFSSFLKNAITII